MDQLEVALRKFKAASEAVKNIAKGEYCALRLQSVNYDDGSVRIEYGVYIISRTWYFAETWEDAIKMLKGHKKSDS